MTEKELQKTLNHFQEWFRKNTGLIANIDEYKGAQRGWIAAKEHSAQSSWISVADRLPEIGQRVLAALDYGGSRIEYVHEDFGDVQTIWKDGKKYEYRYTHWFPLPQNPKASE